MESFFINDDPIDELYRIIRDNISGLNSREHIEHLWSRYRPYAEPDFQKKSMEDMHANYWVMYLGCLLLDAGLKLSTKKCIQGPDIKIDTLPQIWIEATAPKEGTGNNEVVQSHDGEAHDVPEIPFMLRLTSSIVEKQMKHETYMKQSIIKLDEPYIIAINGGRIPFNNLDSAEEPPFIVKAVLPTGNKRLTIKNERVVKESYNPKKDLEKITGPILKPFLDHTYSAISAIIYSNTDSGNIPNNPGNEIHLIHNPIATNPLPKNLIKIGTEWSWEKDTLRWEIHSS